MGKINFYSRTKEIDGVAYTAQFNGLSSWLRAIDESYLPGTNNPGAEKINKYVLENVIVDPKCSIDDFEDIETLNEVVGFGRDVAQGKFRNKTEGPRTGKTAGKE